MKVHTLDYSVYQGEVWERLVILKDKRTHRKRVPTAAAATVLIGTVKYAIPATINSEGGIDLYMTPQNTKWLPVGAYQWDMVATVSRSALLTSTPLAEELVIQGTLTVSAEAHITPMAVDSLATDPLVVVA